MKLKTLLFSLLLSISLSGVSYASFNKGWEAFDKGDYQTALKEWQPLAEQGDAQAQYFLATLYDNGEGVTQDYKAAAKWYRKAAEQGDIDAQFSLATLYDNGEGVTQDYKEAAKWYRKAAEQGDVGAQYNLGVMYERGEGVTQDDKEAVKWYRKASELGHQRAKTRLKRLISKGETITPPLNRNSIANTKYSCSGDLWTFDPIGSSSNDSEHYWKSPEVINNVLSVPGFGEYVQPKKSGKIIWWIRTKGKERKNNWAKIDLSGGESLITKKDSYNIVQFKGKCSKKD